MTCPTDNSIGWYICGIPAHPTLLLRGDFVDRDVKRMLYDNLGDDPFRLFAKHIDFLNIGETQSSRHQTKFGIWLGQLAIGSTNC